MVPVLQLACRSRPAGVRLQEPDSPDCPSDNAERDSYPQNDQHVCARDGERQIKIADDGFRWELESFAGHAVPPCFLAGLAEITRAAEIRSGCDDYYCRL